MVAAALTVDNCVTSKSSSHTLSKKNLPALALGSHVILNLKRHERWRHHGRGITGQSAESVEEFIARRSDLSPGDVQQRSAERFPTFATSLTPTGSPANVRSSLTIWYGTHASIRWAGFHTSNSRWQRGDDRRQVRRARSPIPQSMRHPAERSSCYPISTRFSNGKPYLGLACSIRVACRRHRDASQRPHPDVRSSYRPSI